MWTNFEKFCVCTVSWQPRSKADLCQCLAGSELQVGQTDLLQLGDGCFDPVSDLLCLSDPYLRVRTCVNLNLTTEQYYHDSLRCAEFHYARQTRTCCYRYSCLPSQKPSVVEALVSVLPLYLTFSPISLNKSRIRLSENHFPEDLPMDLECLVDEQRDVKTRRVVVFVHQAVRVAERGAAHPKYLSQVIHLVQESFVVIDLLASTFGRLGSVSLLKQERRLPN